MTKKDQTLDSEIQRIKDEDQEMIQLIKELHDEGKSKDDILMKLFEHKIIPSRQNRLYKESEVATRTENWRSVSVTQFFHNPETTKEEWNTLISEQLEDTKNYLHIHAMISAIAQKKEFI